VTQNGLVAESLKENLSFQSGAEIDFLPEIKAAFGERTQMTGCI
jgi:hypothetical protein